MSNFYYSLTGQENICEAEGTHILPIVIQTEAERRRREAEVKQSMEI